jgi:hypothetical protein
MLEVRLNLCIMEMQNSNNITYTIYYFMQKVTIKSVWCIFYFYINEKQVVVL